jgi:hypothetical protein
VGGGRLPLTDSEVHTVTLRSRVGSPGPERSSRRLTAGTSTCESTLWKWEKQGRVERPAKRVLWAVEEFLGEGGG